jgi:hypothetical protein
MARERRRPSRRWLHPDRTNGDGDGWKKVIWNEAADGEIAHASGARSEKVESDMKAVLEAVNGMREAMDERFRAFDDRLAAQARDLRDVVRALSADVRENSADIRQNSADIRQNSADIQALRVEVTGLRHDFDHREERGRVTALEERVSAIEPQLSTASR